jgi:DHA2 family multidrug resistance protein-like MFS transporter
VAGHIAGRLLHRWGSPLLLARALLVAGLGMAAYWWVHLAATPWQVLSLAVLGFGVGATMTAASATILMSVAPERAGMAASVEEVSYELGGALGVTLMGSMLSAVYAHSLALPALAGAMPASVRDSLDEALLAAEGLPAAMAQPLVHAAHRAFDQGFTAVLLSASVLLVAAAALVRWRMR